LPIDPATLDRGPHYLNVVGRLKPGVTLAQAQAEMSALSARLSQQHPEKTSGHGVKIVRLTDIVVGDIGRALYVLLGAVGFVLLIACANLANLMLARVGGRGREIALRTALGASRTRIVRQLLTESLLLAGAGGVIGLLLAIWAVRWLVSLSPDTIPRANEISVDPRVAAFTLFVRERGCAISRAACRRRLTDQKLRKTQPGQSRIQSGTTADDGSVVAS
jgi:predicted lysophospholipase L1 biosynthesis ABC-type transport system permease subunit